MEKENNMELDECIKTIEAMSGIIECQTNIIEILCSPIIKQCDSTPDWVTHMFD